ncbi:MAG: triose-phosphate isomerase [Deltaproteobacteria bacterium]|jgi:triosephosphate isomerase|nr:triose-phosphate isomerase [Deltaproteobacteria bacterium]
MRDFLYAANWKLNKSPKEAKTFLGDFLGRIPVGGLGSSAHGGKKQVVLFVPALTLSAVVESLGGAQAIQVGLQNAHAEPKGAFTGENSAAVAMEMGAKWLLVGHSERRALFGETDLDTAKKVAAAFQAGMTAMLCVGESLAEREAGKTLEIVRRQLYAVLQDASLKSKVVTEKKFVIAYEPVWAIGTGKVATPEQASEVHQAIRGILLAELGEKTAQSISILYGGSVKPDNAKAIGAMPDIDGFLVGGASLEPASFAGLF